MAPFEKFGEKAQQAWQSFIEDEKLTETQQEQFERYIYTLRSWNTRINLTRILDIHEIVSLHFQDSLRIGDFVDFNALKGFCDVGSGAGFPAIPLKIMYPELFMVLLEVNTKKIEFLNFVLGELGLENYEVCGLDWRTFLRQAPYELDFFGARASLKPDELIRIFKPSCRYRDAQLVYWASKQWAPTPEEASFIEKKELYTVDKQERIFVFFAKK